MKRILFILAQLCLLVSANIVRAQNHVQTITVTNAATTITADGNYNQILLRENAATPSAAFSITLAGSSTAINYPAGTQFLFSGNFSNGQALGTIQATTSGPFSFVAVESSGPPSMSVKNTIINSGGGSMVYPGAGVPLSTGSAWGTSYTVGSAANNLVQLNSSAQVLPSMLPSPSATTLGGIESLSVVAHNFLTGISTSGVPTQAQPAFSDISGSIAASQLPNPSATTLGGIESLTSAAHQWINAISTSGVPSSSQPAYSDISGTPTPTSVALTVPSWLAVGGSPVAPNGTLAVTAATGQTSHQVIGTCGSATSFAPCTLVPGDIPFGPIKITSIPSSDSISSAGAFATTESIPNTNLAVGTVLEIHAHGIYTTTSTASPLEALEVNAGGSTGVCPAGSNLTLNTSTTNGTWELTCFIQIVTTGTSGTASAWGRYTFMTLAGVPVIGERFQVNTGTVTYNTNAASEPVGIQETATLVSGQTMQLQNITVTVWP